MGAMRSSGFTTPGATPVFFTDRPSDQLRRSADSAIGYKRLLACVDNSDLSRAVLRHALAVAQGLDLSVTLARVLEMPQHLVSPTDPIEWQLRCSEGRDQLDRITALESEAASVDSILLAGPPVDELTGWAKDHGVTLLALATHEQRGDPLRHGLGSTAQGILERASASLLLVPPAAASEAAVYRKLLVPLDGSPRAESVLPVATRIARAHGAELVLVHVVPTLEIVGTGPYEPKARDLYEKLETHNEMNARSYIEGLRAQLRNEGLAVQAIVVTDGDARSQLRAIAIEQRIDLIVLSSHGRSGLDDVACGSVTEYLATHAPAPMLIVRPNVAHGFGAAMSGSRAGTRKAAATPSG